MWKHSLVLLAGLTVLHAQTQVDLKTQSKSVDFTGASSTKPLQAGTVLPATCGVGALFFKTDATAGANIYACTSTNAWTAASGSGGGVGGGFTTGSGAPAGTCTVGALYFDIANSNTWFCESPSTWEKVLSTTDVGPFVMTGQNGMTPATPSSGNTALFFASSGKVAQSVDDTGAVGTMVRATDCSGSGRFLQKINVDGSATCAALLPPVTYVIPAGSGSPAAPLSGAWWQDGNTTPICPSGAPYQCYLHWNSGGNALGFTTSVPANWTGGTVSVSLKYQGNGSGNTVQPSVLAGCVSNGGAFAFNGVQNFPSQATSGGNYYITTLASLTMTGCAANSMLSLGFGRTDSSGFVNLAEATITFNLP
jgi:hypothetical protein